MVKTFWLTWEMSSANVTRCDVSILPIFRVSVTQPSSDDVWMMSGGCLAQMPDYGVILNHEWPLGSVDDIIATVDNVQSSSPNCDAKPCQQQHLLRSVDRQSVADIDDDVAFHKNKRSSITKSCECAV